MMFRQTFRHPYPNPLPSRERNEPAGIRSATLLPWKREHLRAFVQRLVFAAMFWAFWACAPRTHVRPVEEFFDRYTDHTLDRAFWILEDTLLVAGGQVFPESVRVGGRVWLRHQVRCVGLWFGPGSGGGKALLVLGSVPALALVGGWLALHACPSGSSPPDTSREGFHEDSPVEALVCMGYVAAGATLGALVGAVILITNLSPEVVEAFEGRRYIYAIPGWETRCVRAMRENFSP